MGIRYLNTDPKPGDVDNVLLGKILQRLAGVPASADLQNNLLRKILRQLNGFAEPGDTDNVILQKILDFFGGSGGGQNLSGASSPQGVVTPEFVGQIFTQDNGDVFRATGLTSADWELIGNLNGLVWGPLPETSADMNLDGAISEIRAWGPSNFTEFSFGNPVTVVNNLTFNNDLDTVSVALGKLETVGGNFEFTFNSALESLALPLLTSVGGNFDLLSNTSLTSLNLNSLVSVGATCSWDDLSSLESISLPLLTTIGGSLTAPNGTLLSSFFSPLWLPTNSTTIDFSGCALTEASIDHILSRCVANPAFLLGSVVLNGGTNSAPGAQGDADVLVLQGRGVTVTTN